MIASIRAIGALLSLLCTSGVLADLDKPTIIDRVYVHPKTKQAALGLVANHPLEQSRAKFDAKVLTYTRYVQSGKLYEQYPDVVRTLPVVFNFTVMIPPNAQAREFLATEKQRLKKQGFEVWVNIYDPKTRELKRE
jgi:hypothetical protein